MLYHVFRNPYGVCQIFLALNKYTLNPNRNAIPLLVIPVTLTLLLQFLTLYMLLSNWIYFHRLLHLVNTLYHEVYELTLSPPQCFSYFLIDATKPYAEYRLFTPKYND